MHRSLITASLLLAAAALPSHAGSRSCTTINGKETCATSSGNLACSTIDNKTVCEGDGMRITQRYHREERQTFLPSDTVRPKPGRPAPHQPRPPQEEEDDDDED